jgi:hypothetical protein
MRDTIGQERRRPMKKCELLVTVKDGRQVVGGILTLDDSGHLTSKAVNKKYETLMHNVPRQDHFIEATQRWTSFKQDPDGWFDTLPSHYTSGELRAKLIGET